MLNSRDISLLRPDVAANCRVWLARCKGLGLNVLITGTVRDDEYQMECYRKGTSQSKRPSFHGVKAGLAFDFCRNVKGQEYSDLAFFRKAAELAEEMGFEWGGRWTSFPDRPHLQWSGHGKYTSAMVRAGKLPPVMPLYGAQDAEKEDVDMTKDEIARMIAEGVTRGIAEYEDAVAAAANRPVSPWAAEAWKAAQAAGIFDGTKPCAPLTREQAAVVLERLGLLEAGK